MFMGVSVSAHLHSYTLHSNVVPLSSRLVSRFILSEAVSDRLRCFHHVLQLVRVRCGVTPQIPFLNTHTP